MRSEGVTLNPTKSSATVPKNHHTPPLSTFLGEVSAMHELDRVISLYHSGKMSLFEAANILDLHPSEFTNLMVEQSRNAPIPLMIRQ